MRSTAAELWGEWERSGVLRPQDYDTDIADYVRALLVRGGHFEPDPVSRTMDRAGWTARDLLRALAPVVASFTGMQRDLLRLLERVGASSGTKDDLRIMYEFVEGDPIDESLAAFRERVRRIEKVVIQLQPLSFDSSHAFDSALRNYHSSEWIEEFVAVGGATDWGRWKFADGVPEPARTGDPRVDERAERVIAMVRRVLARLEGIGEDVITVRDWMYAHDEVLKQDPVLGQIITAATDNWPLSVTSAAQRWTAGIAQGTITASDEFLEELDDWLAGFESGDLEDAMVERSVDDLTDILSLPTWGKRHELYSAWIATQLDRAVDSRLEFVVTEGAVRFPFHETLLAHLDSSDGPVELWCEVRSPAAGALSGGRKSNIQPDYRFQCTADGATTVAAVEVKQYKAAAATRHRGTLRDYVGNLPGATVFLVAHGPLGDGVIDAVPEHDRGRARVHPNVRVGQPRESAAFRADVARLLPPPTPPRPTRIELRWSTTVHDLDLHVRGGDQETSFQTPATAHSTLREDARDGGPAIINILPDADGPLEVRVHVYSPETLGDADPVVTFFAHDARLLELVPADELAGAGERWWNVASIDDAGRLALSSQSREPVHVEDVDDAP
ncbi:hypothetical protein [Occultella kanbiaonis]|uniref:hypothetical protein n=1 Tax=Occultella kanbiaonis TaxID=2675754 RepID=UPI0013D02AEE|nr:hypothetical protein [Occultella kanbiaonis]